jgi:hypothetical protein
MTEDDDLRPSGMSRRTWLGLPPRERAGEAMFAQTQLWDAKGAMSDMKPAALAKEDLVIVARVMLALSTHEMERLCAIGRLAAADA